MLESGGRNTVQDCSFKNKLVEVESQMAVSPLVLFLDGSTANVIKEKSSQLRVKTIKLTES